jgi:4'-phosphopantetheinyl transferase
VSSLDANERDRLAAYRRPEDKARFVTGATIVRHVFAADLGIDPAEVRLDRGCPDCDRPHGKVRLASGQPSDIEVSVSHSGAWVVVAAYRGHPVGVDVERIVADRDLAGVAEMVLTPNERLHNGDFTTYWARKEAVVKALGEGLRTPLRDFEVTAPSAPAKVLAWPARPDLIGRISLCDLDCDSSHRAALAVLDSVPTRVVRRSFSPAASA